MLIPITKSKCAYTHYQIKVCLYPLPNQSVLIPITKSKCAYTHYQIKVCSYPLPNQSLFRHITKLKYVYTHHHIEVFGRTIPTRQFRNGNQTSASDFSTDPTKITHWIWSFIPITKLKCIYKHYQIKVGHVHTH